MTGRFVGVPVNSEAVESLFCLFFNQWNGDERIRLAPKLGRKWKISVRELSLISSSKQFFDKNIEFDYTKNRSESFGPWSNDQFVLEEENSTQLEVEKYFSMVSFILGFNSDWGDGSQFQQFNSIFISLITCFRGTSVPVGKKFQSENSICFLRR